MTIQAICPNPKTDKDSRFPDVYMAKLSDEDRDAIAHGNPVKAVKLGTENGDFEIKVAERLYNGLVRSLMERSQSAYILLWEGGKVPRGVQIGDYTIGWTQNGQVLSADGGHLIGVYDRILEYGGPSENEQQMIIFVLDEKKPEPPNQEQIRDSWKSAFL